jgi:anaerobic selenocysteine-containing dehydrogenase
VIIIGGVIFLSIDDSDSYSLKAALIIGEDPMRNDRTASYFYNMDFCSAIDWAATETTSFADIALPGSTYLESDGTRINFEGKVTTFVKAVDPPAGKTNTEILWMLLNAMGVKTGDETVAGITKEIRKAVEKGTGEFGQFYWSEGERPRWDGKGYLVVPEGYAKAAPIPQPVTVIEHYKKTSREVGIEHFRVQ